MLTISIEHYDGPVGSDDDASPIGDRLVYALKRLHLDLRALHDELLAPLGVGVGHLTVLMLLDPREPLSQQQIAHRLGVDRTTMVSLVDDLEGRGLVVRRPDPTDRRRNVLEITAAGDDALRRGTAASDEAERRLLSGLGESEAETLRDLLRRLVGSRRDW